jgi:hypothetical protein
VTEQDRPNPTEAGGEEPAASPDAAPSPRSEAQEAELAALEAMLPPRSTLPEAGHDGAEGGPSPGDPNVTDRHGGSASNAG